MGQVNVLLKRVRREKVVYSFEEVITREMNYWRVTVQIQKNPTLSLHSQHSCTAEFLCRVDE